MRWLVGFVLLLLALGTLRTVGCGDDDPCGGCDDGNPCTRNVCDRYNTSGTISCDPEDYDYRCVYPSVPDGTSCGGANVCVSGACRTNLCADCEDDGNSCTIDCDYETGACDYLRLPDGDTCKGERHTGVCVSGVCIVCEELDCDDGDLCTDDYCVPDYGGCVNSPVYCMDRDDCTADLCDPVTGECVHTPTDGNWCTANRELGIGGTYLLGSCESGRCTGQPCDVTSEEVYPCPVKDATSSGAPWICCPWEYLPENPRGYCVTDLNCDHTRCEEECPDTESNPQRSSHCIVYADGDCAVVDYCFAECASHYIDCMYQDGVCPSP